MNKDLARKLVKVISDNFTPQEIKQMIQELNILSEGIDLLNICTMAQMRKTFEAPEGEKGV